MTSMLTFFWFTKKLKENQNENLCRLLSKEQTIVCSANNSQKGHQLTYQTGASSNKFINVTGWFFKQFTPTHSLVINPSSYNVEITYVNQPIPYPSHMVSYEKIIYVPKTTVLKSNIIASLIRNKIKDINVVQDVNCNGIRVTAYATIITICYLYLIFASTTSPIIHSLPTNSSTGITCHLNIKHR